MDFARFEASLGEAAPPAGAGAPLRALWHQAKGDWPAAHRLAQGDKSAAGAWVHAHLHRAEGDQGNAGYWYRRAGRPPATESLKDESAAIARALCAGDEGGGG